MQQPLSPAKLLATGSVFKPGETPTWFRLRRTDDGLLCLESVPAGLRTFDDPTAALVVSEAGPRGPGPVWAFVADVPPNIARQLVDDDSPDNVATVLSRALRMLGIS